MIAQARFEALKGIKPHEWAVRFVFGGLCTVVAGLVAQHFGPRAGGLFLAFPAIFPAGACLIEQHEKKHKLRAGFDGTRRARVATGVDAAGASLGCIGLAVFAAIVWKALPKHNAGAVIAAATGAWLVVSVALWLLRKSSLLRRKGRSVQVFR